MESDDKKIFDDINFMDFIPCFDEPTPSTSNFPDSTPLERLKIKQESYTINDYTPCQKAEISDVQNKFEFGEIVNIDENCQEKVDDKFFEGIEEIFCTLAPPVKKTHLKKELIEPDIVQEEIFNVKNDTSSQKNDFENSIVIEVIHAPKDEVPGEKSPQVIDSKNFEAKEIFVENNDTCSQANHDPEELVKALELNKKAMEGLLQFKKHMKDLLSKCRSRQHFIDEKLSKVWKPKMIRGSAHLSIPYFKTPDSYFSPLNEDAKLKKSRGELDIINLKKTSRWTVRDKNILHSAIMKQVKAKILASRSQERLASPGGTTATVRELLKYAETMSESEIDWMKLETGMIHHKHMEEECRVMWKVFMNPSTKKDEWTQEEDENLATIAKRYKLQNWEKIATELGNGRTEYQCFVRYTTHNGRKKLKENIIWTKEEDKQLKHIVASVRIGNFIPWNEVGVLMPGKVKSQAYYHWTYNLAPHLRKGRFTDEESETLLKGIEKFGHNFAQIRSMLMPHRTTAQLNDHYKTLCTRECTEKLGEVGGRIWEIEEDEKLVFLQKQFGNNWSKIAEHFSNKSRTQVRHRYTALKRYELRGIPLYSIPRSIKEQKEYDVDLDESIDDVDQEIIAYFRRLRPRESYINYVSGNRLMEPEEVETSVKTLYNVLQSLHVNVIASNFVDQDRLSERDRQLFQVLNDFIMTGTMNSEKVEECRYRMFGPDPEIPETERFVPAPPFATKTFTKKQKRQLSKCDKWNLDYSPPEVLDIEIIPVTCFGYSSPEVQEVMGADVDLEYDMLKRILVTEEKTLKEKRIVVPSKKIVILTPQSLNNSAHFGGPTSYMMYSPAEADENNVYKNLLSFTWDWGKCPTFIEEESMFHNGLKLFQTPVPVPIHSKENFPAIKPNFSTLMAYRALLDSVADRVVDFPISEENQLKVSDRGKVALDLLKRRFDILFTYPLNMSEVAIPEIIESKSIFDVNNEKDDVEVLTVHTQKSKRKKVSTKTTKKNKRRKLSDSDLSD